MILSGFLLFVFMCFLAYGIYCAYDEGEPSLIMPFVALGLGAVTFLFLITTIVLAPVTPNPIYSARDLQPMAEGSHVKVQLEGDKTKYVIQTDNEVKVLDASTVNIRRSEDGSARFEEAISCSYDSWLDSFAVCEWTTWSSSKDVITIPKDEVLEL